MHVGIATGCANHSSVNDAQFVSEELSQLVLAEELGFDSVWITEHHFSNYSIAPNPLNYLMYIAARTKRVRLGTQVIVVPWHDPVRLAEEIATLDIMSGGRAIIGFGRGLSRMEYEGLRVDQNKARQLFDEIVPMVMQAMETGYIEGGEIFKQPRREIRPRPIRSLKGRAFVAAGSPPSMISAAKLGLGRLYLGQPMVGGKQRRLFNAQAPQDTGKTADEEMQAADAWLDSWMENRPHETPPAPFMSNMIFIDESTDRALELANIYAASTFLAAVKNYELTSSHHGGIKGYESYQGIAMSEEAVKKAAENAGINSIHGTPQQVLEKLDAIRSKHNPQGMMPHLYTGGMPHNECIRSMHLFAKKCLPEMKSWPAAPSTIDPPFLAAAE